MSYVMSSFCLLESRSARGIGRSRPICCDRGSLLGRGCIGVPPDCESCLARRIWICRGSSADPPDFWNSGGRRGCTGDPPDSVGGRGRAVGVSHAQTDRSVRLDCTCVPPDSVTPRVAEIDGHGCLD